MYRLLRSDAVARRASTATDCLRPVRSSHSADAASPTAPTAAADVSPMRKDVGRIGSVPPENSTPADSPAFQPTDIRMLDSAWSAISMDAP